MFSSKRAFIYSFSFIISSLLLFSTNFERKTVETPHRKLLDSDQKKEIETICKRSEESIQKYYLTGVFPGDKPNKDEDPTKDEGVKYIIGLLDSSQEGGDLKKFLMSALVWVVFIVFGVLLIPGWVVICNCSCCPCCCCRQTQKHQYICRFVAFIGFCTMFALIISISIYGFFGLNSILKGFDGTTCSVMRMYVEIVEGQSSKQKPKWTGISSITDILTEMTNAVKEVGKNTNTVKNDKNAIPTLENEYEELIKKSYPTVKDETIEFEKPDSKTSVKINPSYINDYGEYSTSGKQLYIIHQEFKEMAKLGKELLEETSKSAEEVEKQTGEIEGDISKVTDTVDGFGSTFDSFSDSVINPWLDYQDMIHHYGNLIFNCFFGVYLGLGAAITALTVLFVFLGIKIMKLFIHIIWNILILITIFTFILGGIIGLIGTVGKTGTGVMIYIISEDNLNKGSGAAVLSGDAAEYLSVCINGDGNLAGKLGLESSATDLNKLYDLKAKVNNVVNTLDSNKESKVCKNVDAIYDGYKKNFLNIDNGSNSADSLASVNKYCNDLTDCPNNQCNIKESWAINKESCTKYSYQSKTAALSAPLTTGKCLVYSEWTEGDIDNHYNSVNGNFDKQKVKDCVKAFKDVEDKNNKIIEKILHEDDVLAKKYQSSVVEIKKKVENTEKLIIDPIQNVFGEYIGENGKIFDVVNCKFLGGHVNLVIKELNKAVGVNFYNFGVVVEVLSMASVLGVAFLIPVLNRFHKVFDDKKPSKKGNAGTLTEEKMLTEKEIKAKEVVVHKKAP